MIVLGTVTLRKNVGGSIERSIVGLLCRFIGSVGFIRTLSLQLRLISCQILSTLHISLCMGLIRLPMFHVPGFASIPKFACRLAERLRLWTAGSPRSRRLSRPWPRPRRLGTGLRAFRSGRLAFPAVDGYLAPAPASVGWAPGSAPLALDGWLSQHSTAISPLPLPP